MLMKKGTMSLILASSSEWSELNGMKDGILKMRKQPGIQTDVCLQLAFKKGQVADV